ncbi:DNA-binding anti-repressor SinI [Halobacillus fulvus]|nr:DNA-binding anti-repressor SinI [Halobacillus fulvus]
MEEVKQIDKDWIKMMQEAKQLGLSIKDIQYFIKCQQEMRRSS